MSNTKPLTKGLSLPSFKNQELWQRALTHRSYANEHPPMLHNERLEFLGDALLGFVVGEFLYQQYPTFRESKLTQLRAQLVNESQLARLALALGIDRLMQLGKGAENNGERQNPSLLSDTLEAIIGAYYLDAGFEACRQFIQTLLQSALGQETTPEKPLLTKGLVDVKNQLQQWALQHQGQLPDYILLEETGPSHAREFTFAVKIQNQVYGQGKGLSKQLATKAAATAALQSLGLL
jgi:ribonuclease-3